MPLPKSLYSDLIKGVVYAKRILTATETELSRPSAVREAPDGHFEFVLHAAVFLLKVLPHLQESAELSHSLIERVAALMSAVSRNHRDTPALYAALLFELSRNVRGHCESSPPEDPFSPVITAQTRGFAKMLVRSQAWKVGSFASYLDSAHSLCCSECNPTWRERCQCGGC